MTTETKQQTTYTDAQLRYAAFTRCECGAGMAYPKNGGRESADSPFKGPFAGAWECSDILTGRAIPKDQPAAKTHTAPLPFAFYEVKSEDQPSANGATTRPAETPEEKKARETEDERAVIRARIDGVRKLQAQVVEAARGVTARIDEARKAGLITPDDAAQLAYEVGQLAPEAWR